MHGARRVLYRQAARAQTSLKFNDSAQFLLFKIDSHPIASNVSLDYVDNVTKIASDAVVSMNVSNHVLTKNHSSKPTLSLFRRPMVTEDPDLNDAMQYISKVHLAPCSSDTPLLVIDKFFDWGLGNNFLCKFIPCSVHIPC